MQGNATGITVKNAKDHIIDYDIVVPTDRGGIYACRFIRDAELAATSTGIKMRMNINKAHALLGHGSDDTTRQTALELGWTIT